MLISYIKICFAQTIICICFCFLIVCSHSLYGQQPGGVDVPGSVFWLIPSVQGTQYKWISKNGNSDIIFKASLTNAQNINFNTALKFSKNLFPILLSNVRPLYIVSAFYPNISNSPFPVPDSFYHVRFNGMALAKLSYDGINDIANNSVKSRFPITLRNINTAMKISVADFSMLPATDKSKVGGTLRETNLMMTFDGYCPEMLVYERPLSLTDLWKIETYFAIKYGITLDTSYKGTDEKVLWDIGKRILFHHRVCAIGKDRMGAIAQPFSNTTYEEGNDAVSYKNSSDGPNRSVTIGFEKANFDALPDKNFLFWGDDENKEPGFDQKKITGSDPGDKIKLVKRKWLMQNEDGIVQMTTLQLGGGLLEQLKENDQCYLLVKLDGQLDSSDIYPLDNQMKNGKWFRNNIAWKNGVDTFTFGKVKKMSIQEVWICNYKFCAYDKGDIKGRKTLLGIPVGRCRFILGYR